MGLSPWLFAIPEFTHVNLVITDEDGRQATVQMSSWAWLSTMATPLDLYRLYPTWKIIVTNPPAPKKDSSGRLSRTSLAKDNSRSAPDVASCSGRQRGIVSSKSDVGCTRLPRERKNAAELTLDGGLLSEDVIRSLIDDWIVPSVVERVISSISNPPLTPKG